MTVESISITSLTLSVIVTDSITDSSYNISYDNTDCPHDTYYDDINGISDTLYTLTELQEGTEYSITITVILNDGWTEIETVTVKTLTVG